MVFLKNWLVSFLLLLWNKPYFRVGKCNSSSTSPQSSPRSVLTKMQGKAIWKKKLESSAVLVPKEVCMSQLGKDSLKTFKIQFQFCCYYCTKCVRWCLWLNNKQCRCSSQEWLIYLTKLTRCIYVSKTTS